MSNWIVFAVLAAVSVFLLWLWYFLGFNKVDSTLDLVMTFAWWVVVAVLVYLIARIEQDRRQEVRTIYVARDMLFNSEMGLVPVDGGIRRIDAMEKVLDGLGYGFNKADMPDEEDFLPLFVVRTSKYQRATGDGEGSHEPLWQGTVIRVNWDGLRSEKVDFDGRPALEALLT